MPDLDFTGERMIPGKVDPQLEFEHLSRYRFATRWTRGKRVVDLGCGAGYGVALLKAAGAQRAIGVDIALEATLFAEAEYGGEGVAFVTGDCTQSCLRPSCADVVIAFEVIEHLEAANGLLANARELLAGSGVFLVSTPNRRVYTDASQSEPNPFHVKEFYYGEFLALLSDFFPEVRIVGQSTTEGTLFRPVEGAAELTSALAGGGEGGEIAEMADYLVAVCGFEAGLGDRPLTSEFVVSSDNVLRLQQRRIRDLQNELEERLGWVSQVAVESDERGAQIRKLQVELEERTRWALDESAQNSERADHIVQMQEELTRRANWALSLDAQVAAKGNQVSALEADLAERRRRVEELETEAERSRAEAAALREKLEERLQMARKLAREVEERDRQFLQRLREIESLQSRTASLEAERQHSDVLLAASLRRLETAGALIGELELQSRDQEAKLAWYGESSVQLSRRVRDVENSGTRLQSLGEELERASYQHQIGLDHHTDWLRAVDRQLLDLKQLQVDQGADRKDHALLAKRVGDIVESRLWRSYTGLGSWWRRLRRTPTSEVTDLKGRLREASRSLVVARRPLLSIVLLADASQETLIASLAGVSAASQKLACEVLVADLQGCRTLGAALEGVEGLRSCRLGRQVHPLQGALGAARGEHVLFVSAGVRLDGMAIEALRSSFASLPGAAVVAPRLLSEHDELLAFGGVTAADGTAVCAAGGQDWEALELSYARSTEFAPGVCFMARASVVQQAVLSSEAAGWGLTEAANLGRRLSEMGFHTYVQPRASAICDGAVETKLRGLPTEFPAAPAESAGPRILIVDHRLPTPNQDSGSVRMAHMLDIMRELGFAITFVPENLLASEPYCSDLQRVGIEVAARPWVLSATDFIEENAHRFDCVMVCRCHVAADFMPQLRAALPGKPIIFDTVDLQFLRERRRAKLEGSARRARKAEEVRKAELAIARESTAVLVVSRFELELVRAEIPGVDVRLVSNIHRVPGRTRGFHGRKDIFFIGGFEHPPNVDAVKWLAEEILPMVRREIPGLRAHVIGSKPTAEVEALASQHVHIAGFVPDMTDYLSSCRLSVAPLRYGAGVKGKVNQSLAHGVPCVLTSVAAEGMELVDGRDARIADTPEDFAKAIVEIYRRPWLWHRLSRNGVRNTRRRFSVRLARDAMEALFADLGVQTVRSGRKAAP